MKFYDLDTKFTFGKFENKTMKEILDSEPYYIDWCAINLDHFYISERVINKIKQIEPNFSITAEAKQKLEEKYASWEESQEANDYDGYDDYDDYNNGYDSYDDWGGHYWSCNICGGNQDSGCLYFDPTECPRH